MLSGLAAIMTECVPRLGCVRASKIMHWVLLGGAMRAPLSFFDITPVGRLLSRFAKDIDVLDNTLPMNIADTLYCAFEVNSQVYKFLVNVCLVSFVYTVLYQCFLGT